MRNRLSLMASALLLAGAVDAAPVAKGSAGAAALTQRGQASEKATNYGEAMRWYLAAAAKGDAEAMLMLGGLYFEGKGVAEDQSEALKWHRASAAKGNGRAMWYVGMAYLIGKAVPKNYAEGVRWFRLSAARGDDNGQNSLGEMFRTGSGVTRDLVAALRYYRLAADQGDRTALSNMAGLIRTGGPGVPKNEAEADRLSAAVKSTDPKKWRSFVAPVQVATPAAPARTGRYPWIVNRASTSVTLYQNGKQICVMAPDESCGEVYVVNEVELQFRATSPSGADASLYRQFGRDVPVHICIRDGLRLEGC